MLSRQPFITRAIIVRRSPQLSMPGDNESQPQDAQHQDRTEAEAQAAELASSSKDSSGSLTSKSAAVQEGLCTADHGVRHLTTLLGKPASDLDQEVARLKTVRAEMKKDKKRLSAQLRNTERKRSRLCTRAKAISSNDLLEVYAMRVRGAAAKTAKRVEADPADKARQ